MHANCRVRRRCHIVEGVHAVIAFVGVKEWLLNQVEMVQNIWERGVYVDVPLGGTITNNETLKIQLGLGLSDSNLLIVLVDLPSEVGDIDTSITLT